MESSNEKKEYLYSEPIKGDVYRYEVTTLLDSVATVKSKDGFYLLHKSPYSDVYYSDSLGYLYLETEEWKVKYQESLYLRVCQAQVKVYFVNAMKRGKVNTRALVIDDNGSCYHTFVPTFPPPQLGESFMKLRMDLTVVSLTPVMDIYEKVMAARRLNPVI